MGIFAEACSGIFIWFGGRRGRFAFFFKRSVRRLRRKGSGGLDNENENNHIYIYLLCGILSILFYEVIQ